MKNSIIWDLQTVYYEIVDTSFQELMNATNPMSSRLADVIQQIFLNDKNKWKNRHN